MHDGLNQVGKYLKSTVEKADTSLKRYLPTEPSTERIRDVIDADNAMSAFVITPYNADRVMLDLDFRKRLETVGCCADCFCTDTDSYTGEQLVNGTLYLPRPYVAGSTTVMINGGPATLGVDYVETSPENGAVTFLGGFVEAIVISYVYTLGNCSEAICIEEFFPNCPGAGEFGGTLVFSDRMDLHVPGSHIPTGGCGYWAQPASNNLDSKALFPEDNQASVGSSKILFGGLNMVGASYNILIAFPHVANLTIITAGGAFFSNSFAQLQVSIAAEGLGEDSGNGLGPSYQSSTASNSLAFDPGSYAEPIYARIYSIAGSRVGLRIWKQTEQEGGSSTLEVTASIADAVFDEPVTNPVLRQFTLTAINFSSGAAIQAIKVYGHQDIGLYNAPRDFSWAVGNCYGLPQAEVTGGDGYTTTCGSQDSTTTTGGPTGVGELQTTWPSYASTMAWKTFTPDDGSGKVASTSQTYNGYNTNIGKPTILEISGYGAAWWNKSDRSTAGFSIQGIPGNTPSSGSGQGITLTAYHRFTDPTSGNAIFDPFTVRIPAFSERAGWTIASTSDAGLAAGVRESPGFLSAPNWTLDETLTAIRVKAIGGPVCVALDFCGYCPPDATPIPAPQTGTEETQV